MSPSRQSPGSASELHLAAEARVRGIHHSYTSRRRAIVELLGCADQPLSIPEMLERDPKLVQSSVYRNLGVLEMAGVVQRIVTTDEFARFEVAEALSGHHHHHLDLAAGLLVEAEAEDADLCQLVPYVAAPAEFGVGDLVAALEVVATGQQISGGVAEQDLFVGQLKVHGRPHNPRMVDEMMLRCTSLLPP